MEGINGVKSNSGKVYFPLLKFSMTFLPGLSLLTRICLWSQIDKLSQHHEILKGARYYE
jgi:hypothetical protein